MGSLLLVLVTIALVVGFFGWHRSSGVRATARWVSGLLFLVLLAATLAMIYGTFALSSKGGGVLILLALPLGIVTWIAGAAFFSSGEAERYYELPTEERGEYNRAKLDESLRMLRESVARKTAERDRIILNAGKRARLSREIAHEEMMIGNLTRMRASLDQRQPPG